ncbi:TPA: hypothetical protein ACTZGC_001757 [Raoultella ornithinolytica]
MTITLQAVNELIASLESAGELSIKEGKYLELAKAYQQLAAESVGLKSFGDTLFDMYKGLDISGGGIHDEQSVVCQQAALDAAMSAFEEIETPATDRIIAEAEAQGAEAYETALLTSDDDDFTYEASIFVEETHQQREVADK